MSRPKGSIIGARPTWTTTATSGIWTLRQAEEMKAANQWPRGPVAPTSLAGTPGDGQVALTWTAPATTHGTITDYVVEYTPAAGSPTVVATGSTAASYTLTGLTNDTEYTFRVAGVNHTRGDWSDSVAVTPNSGPSDPDFASVSLLLHADGADASTTFTDSSSGGLTVTANGAAQISTSQSKFGGASGRFQSSGDYLQLTHGTSFGAGDFTIETWLYSPWNTNDNIIFEFRTTVNLVCWINSGGAVWIYTPATSFGNRGTIATNQWAHFALARDSGTVRLYLDGLQAWSGSDSGTIDTSGNLYIGRAFDALREPNFFFDDYRISTVCRYPSGTTFTPPTAAFPDA